MKRAYIFLSLIIVLFFAMVLFSCEAVKKTDMKNENIHPKIVWAKLKGDTTKLKNYQFLIDNSK